MEQYAELYNRNKVYLSENMDELFEEILRAVSTDVFYCTKSRHDQSYWILEVFTSRDPNPKLDVLRVWKGDGAHFVDYHVEEKYVRCLDIKVNPLTSNTGDVECKFNQVNLVEEA
jgi:hypothetical protein